jgi:sugar lactone lactonase YvrE
MSLFNLFFVILSCFPVCLNSAGTVKAPRMSETLSLSDRKFSGELFAGTLSYRPPTQLSHLTVSLESVSSNVQVIAGTATSGFSGDNAQATTAQLQSGFPWVDSIGNIFIPDGNHRIRKVDTRGNITTFGGLDGESHTGAGGPIGSVSFCYPYSVVGDPARTVLYFSDQWYVWKYLFSSGIVSVFAQSTTLGQGFTGDNGPPNDAQLSRPMGLWLTTSGDVYIADHNNHRIRKVSSGIITTVVGSGCSNGCSGSFSGENVPATSATLKSPSSVYMSTNGELFIADSENYRVRLVDTNQIITTFAGSGTSAPFNGNNIAATSANLNIPNDMKSDSLGNIFIADYSNCIIRMVDANTKIISTVFGSPSSCGFTPGITDKTSPIGNPWGLWVDTLSRIYFSDHNAIHRSFTVPAPIPSALSFKTVLAGTGTSGYSGDGGPATSAQLNPRLPWVNSNGNIYIPDGDNYRIRKVDTSGIITTFAGSGAQSVAGGGGGTSVSFYVPTCVVGDSAGTFLYISDRKYVWKYEFSSQSFFVFAGTTTSGFNTESGGAAVVQLNSPSGLWLTTSDELYIADYSNHRIRKVSSTIITTVAGSGSCGAVCTARASFSGDGSLATSAQLKNPLSVFMNTNGELFIADSENYRIRMVDTNQIISTYAGSGISTPFGGENLDATSANINTPKDVKGDSLGNIFIAENGNCIIRMVEANTRLISTVFGSSGSCNFTPGISLRTSRIGQPVGIWVDSLSRVYFSDSYNAIYRSTTVSEPTSEPSRQPTSQPTSEPIAGPSAQPTQQPTRQPTGQPTSQPTVIPFSKLYMQVVAGREYGGSIGDNGPASSAEITSMIPFVGNNGDIFIPQQSTNTIRKVSSTTGIITVFAGSGTHGIAGTSGSVLAVNFHVPFSVVGNAAGNLFYTSDQVYIWKIDLNTNTASVYVGVTSSTGGYGFSGDNGPASSALLSSPMGLWLTTSGVLYIADYYNHRIRKVTASPSAIITTVAGSGCFNGCASAFSGDNGLATSARLTTPEGVYVDSNGKLYIADTGNNRIRLVDTNKIITTFAGSGSTPFNGEKIPATSANIQPVDVKGDSMGNIYIADGGHFIIRVVDTNDIIMTLFGSYGGSGFWPGITPRNYGINIPQGIWVDSQATVYFSDYNSIRRGFIPATPTSQPSRQPMGFPTAQPTRQPFGRPSSQPSNQPASQPSKQPIGLPTAQPTQQPFARPSGQPSSLPTGQPSKQPVGLPTTQPTRQPSGKPSGPPSSRPSGQPSRQPTSQPSKQPMGLPTAQPTRQPFGRPSGQPSSQPTMKPSGQPSIQPSTQPSCRPASRPSGQPTRQPLGRPSSQPTSQPTASPSDQPTKSPSVIPSWQPTSIPSTRPTGLPSRRPSSPPTNHPSGPPAAVPTSQPTVLPTRLPVSSPSALPSSGPSTQPTSQPTTSPSNLPSVLPSTLPTIQPSLQPTSLPSVVPSAQPSSVPSTSLPTVFPSTPPSVSPSIHPSYQPASFPSQVPSTAPTSQPTKKPFSFPTRSSAFPSSQPTNQRTVVSSNSTNALPSVRPTTPSSNISISSPTSNVPSVKPSQCPTVRPSAESMNNSSWKPTNVEPSTFPSEHPTSEPGAVLSSSNSPNVSPTTTPTSFSSCQPTQQLTCIPTSNVSSSSLSVAPSTLPSAISPSALPSVLSTNPPSEISSSVAPTQQPSFRPSIQLMSNSSFEQSVEPSCSPSAQPTTVSPSEIPSSVLTVSPMNYSSSQPTLIPSMSPTCISSTSPSLHPTCIPTIPPSLLPSCPPSNKPTCHPSRFPSSQPTITPSVKPSRQPTRQPTSRPSRQPIGHPTGQPTSSPLSSIPTSIPSIITESPTPLRNPSISAYPSQTRKPTRQPVTSRPIALPTVCPSFRPTLLPTQPISVFPSKNGHFKESLFFFGSYLPAVETIPNIYLTDETVGSSYVIFGLKDKVKEITLGVNNAHGHYSPVMKGAGLMRDQAMSRTALLIGDFNGDSYEDLLICDPMNCGCFIYFCGENGFQNLQVSFAVKSNKNDLFGWSAAKLNDVNNDTFGDIAVTALSSNVIYIVLGSNLNNGDVNLDAVGLSFGIKIIGSRKDQNSGLALSLAGDFNNDGFSDLLFSAIQSDPYQSVIYVLFLRPESIERDISMDNLTPKKDYVKIIAPLFSFAGFSLSNLGDINQDGFDDIIIGSIPYSGRYLTQKSYVLYGRNSSRSLFLTEMTEEDGFVITGGGFLVGGPGDVNGDGIPDIMISSYEQWQGKGNSYILVYPRNMTSPPTFLPSSQPSSVPSSAPTTIPSESFRYPTSFPTFEDPTNAPTRYGTFPPFLQRTEKPSLAPKTSKPTRIPSMKPSTRSPTIRTPAPSVSPSRKPTIIPTKRPTQLPTTEKPSNSPTKQPFTFVCPTSFPSMTPTVSLSTSFQDLSLDKEGIYSVPNGKVNVIISGGGSVEVGRKFIPSYHQLNRLLLSPDSTRNMIRLISFIFHI